MKKNWKYSLLLITVVVAVAMGVFFLFYRFDNKYTAKGDQAIQGILYTVTIDDEVSEMSLTFGVTLNDDNTLTLDMGDLGSATVEEAFIAVAVQGLKYAVENGTEMN